MTALSHEVGQHHDFLNPLCSHRTIANFLPRRAVLSALEEHLAQVRGTVLDIGYGKMPYKAMLLASPSRAKKYIGLDLPADVRYHTYKQASPDLEWDGRTIPLETGSIDSAIATEVFEQCADVEGLLREAARVLAPGGMLFFTVPFLWAIHDFPNDQYRFTPYALDRHLRKAGFQDVKMRALGGWDASLAQMIGLWAGRRPMPRIPRAIVSRLAVPVVSFLLRWDAPPSVPFDFDATIMITGIAGTAVKPLAS